LLAGGRSLLPASLPLPSAELTRGVGLRKLAGINRGRETPWEGQCHLAGRAPLQTCRPDERGRRGGKGKEEHARLLSLSFYFSL
jgi:hypothetical protein